MEREVARLKAELEALKKRYTEAQKSLEGLNALRDELTDVKMELNCKAAKRDATALDEERAKAEKLSGESSDLKREIKRLQKLLDETQQGKSNMAALQKEISMLEREKARLQKLLDAADGGNADTEKELAAAKRELEALKKTHSQCESRERSLERELIKDLQRKMDNTEAELRDLRAQAKTVPKLQARIRELEEELAKLKLKMAAKPEPVAAPEPSLTVENIATMRKAVAHMKNLQLGRGFNRMRDECTIRRYHRNLLKRVLAKWTKDHVQSMFTYLRDYVEVMKIRELERQVSGVKAFTPRGAVRQGRP